MDIYENIHLAREFTKDISYQEFINDKRTIYAVTRALEIISETARRLPDEFLARTSQIPWQDIKGAGNIYRHDYEDVAEQILWNTVQNALDPLNNAVTAEISLLTQQQ